MKTVFETLTLDQIKELAPSTFQTQQKAGLSEHYVHIPTDRVINDMMSLGWLPCDAKEIKARKSTTVGYQRHMIKFFNPNIEIEGNDGDMVYPQIVLTNSHDGLSSFKFQIGLFRLVCSNGLVIADQSYGDFKLRHMGYTFAELQIKINEAVDSFPALVEKMDQFSQTELSEEQMVDFAHKAIKLRFNNEKSNTFVDIEGLLNVDRKEDEGNDLWSVYNRVQEKIIGGGFRYGNKNRKARTIKNFNQDLKINEALWELASEYVSC